MKTSRRTGLARLCASAALALAMAASSTAFGQQFADVGHPDEPLVLKRQGSFMVGGESVEMTGDQLSSIFGQPMPEGGTVVVNQMYVEFMEPMEYQGPPIVLLHGATLSGKTYETTPDGRMGWDEYFVRHGYGAFVPDQVSRARSGFDIRAYNDVRMGKIPARQLPNAFRQSDQINWRTFRFGPAYGTPFEDQQFPMDAIGQMSTQAIPDLNATLPQPNPTFKALADLAVQLDGAVLLGHSESGAFPLFAALTNPAGVRGAVLVEPGACGGYPQPWSEEQIATLARIPILAVFGDHLEVDTGMHGFSWKTAYDNCQAFIERVNAAGGNAEMLHPPSQGIRGNSHMIMMDRNSLEIAEMIIDWMRREVGPLPLRPEDLGSEPEPDTDPTS